MPTTGPLSIGVPGMIDGYDQLLQRFGSRSFASLAADAIRHAEEGVALNPMCQAASVLHQAMLAKTPSTAAILLPGGKPMLVGQKKSC
jgi:gamma-glutamyltranspeptidase/glutathione hydrolase